MSDVFYHLGRVSAVLLIVLLAACAGPLGTDRSRDGPDVVDPRKIVALVPDAGSAAGIRAAARTEGYRPLEERRLPGLGLIMLSYQMAEGVTGPEAIAALEGAVPASVVGINHAYRLQQQAPVSASLSYANRLMRWPVGGCRALAPIGMIDAGLDPAAPSLSGARIVTRKFYDGASLPSPHGADVASILVSPDRLRGARLFAADVFGQADDIGLVAGADALVRALDWLAGQDVRFVNLALAGPYNKLLDLAVERAVARGLILVAAVGNEGPNAAPRYPAGFEGVIAVTAVDADERIYRRAVRGPHVDFAAPGVDILVRSRGSARFVTGTSMATPFVTARLAADPALTSARSVGEVRSKLAASSAELGAPGRDPVFGHGLVLAEGICN